MDVEIGSNLYQNTDGTIEIEGVPQIEVSIRQPPGTLMVNFALFDESGRMVAKIVESTLFFNERRAYELTKTPAGLALHAAESGQTVLRIELKGGNRIVLNQAKFPTIRGRTFEVSPHEWRIEKRQQSGKTTDAKGGAVVIG